MTDTELKDAFESLDSQVERLANFIMGNIPGEPSQSEGAIDCAIRLLRKAYVGGADARKESAIQDASASACLTHTPSPSKQTLPASRVTTEEFIEIIRKALEKL